MLDILKKNEIQALVDVRSNPFSKYKPEFNADNIKKSLITNKMLYVYLGKELGARSLNDQCYIDNRADYTKISQTPEFNHGLNRIIKGLAKFNIVLLCAEQDPLKCHRNILVCRNLKNQVKNINHILKDGIIETNSNAEDRLLREYGLIEDDFFTIPEERLKSAYDKRSLEIAYKKNDRFTGEEHD